MAESSSNSSTSTSTGNGGTTGAGSSTSTSTTGNSGAAASGSQSSSNGSFSTGNSGNGNSNTGPGLSFSAGVTSNSNGNFSGGLPGMAPGFTGFASSNFGQGWGSNSSGSSTNNVDSTKTEPVMTVDEVYGKGNQSIVESQGDYEATSNEKSNVETSTFGKQDEISVTPLSVTEDKGLVNNDAIQSVEGLNFQQKDKANQEVMEAKKSRDEAEAEDNADGMRDQLKSVAEKDAEETETDAFKVGESEAEKAYNDEDAAWQQALQEQKDSIEGYKNSIENTKAEIAHYEARIAEGKTGMKDDLDVAKTELAGDTKTLEALQASYDEMEQQYNSWKDDSKSKVEKGEMVEALAAKAKEKANKAFEMAQKEREYAVTKLWNDRSKESISRDIDAAIEALKNAEPGSKDYENAVHTLNNLKGERIMGFAQGGKYLQALYPQEAIKALVDVNPVENPEGLRQVINNLYDSQTQRFKDAYDAIANSKESEETKAHAIDVFKDVAAARYYMKEAADKLALNPDDPVSIETYSKALETLTGRLENALKDENISKTDFNKAFTEMVADANNFMVTKEDGTKQNFAEFAIEMVTKSPEIAAGMYKAKADRYAKDGHKVLAAIETAKSKMVMTWLGSKVTFADNQVRNQFVQMAKTDMRATYAAYNNVLNDPNATPEAKAEASAAINQANGLMTASAALQASTGFFSGISDGTSDGVYGVTDPGKLNGYQEALNAASNYAKIALGLGVTPGANEAYQNMYYMAGAKVNQSNLFSKDFDSDGFALCQEYGNNAAVGMIVGAGELATGVALMFNPATSKMGINLAIDSVQTFLDGLYGVQKEVNKSIKYSNEVLSYFNEAKSIAAETGNKEATSTMDSAIKQIEDFQLKSDEVGNLDNWLEGSGSNTADNGKFNQALTYDEWLKLIEADPVMQEYAKSLNR